MDDTETTTATSPRTYFRPTTASQRRLLFRQVAAGATVPDAAAQAHVGRGTYYYWRDRYAAAGEASLAECASCAPKHPRVPPISAAIEAEVLAYYDAHPHERSGRMIAERLRQAHDGQAVIGHSKVAEILRQARPPAAPAPTPAAPGVATPAAPAGSLGIAVVTSSEIPACCGQPPCPACRHPESPPAESAPAAPAVSTPVVLATAVHAPRRTRRSTLTCAWCR